MPRRIPVCGCMLSVRLCIRCTCPCGVWLCTVHKVGNKIELSSELKFTCKK